MSEQSDGALTRRGLLLGAGAGLGAVAAIGIDRAVASQSEQATQGEQTIPFHGAHQAGIAMIPQAYGSFYAFDLKDGVDRDGLRKLMRLLTDDAERLTAGRPALADSEPELALVPARLTITFGFGREFVRRADPAAVPNWLGPLPAFEIDNLDPAWSEGDLLIQIAADDPVTVSHAARMILKDTRSFASLRWLQKGFRRAAGSMPENATMRNLFGQLDGTVNPRPGTDEFNRLVWSTDGWLANGTSIVIRRIDMNLETWDEVDRPGREQSVGRFQDSGAPLTGTNEHDEPDFEAVTSLGLPVIAEYAHMRRARSDNPEERIFRRAYNYDDTPPSSDVSNAGQIFTSFQADVDRQYVPIQTRLAELDLLNQWTEPIGSAVFAIPPGCAEGGYIGETLLS
ncbi:Dyp-type peroxidase [Flaviflexus salsibiostraticola]|uniref:Dyp-type peroxidase n=1 Tax=Flaviflexus salsibiostraticola TaxID=1282737 RepID=A0A3S8ZB16_9ACTO|nr:Dyp-type peroxidase [Flaviflexus salsibiostraticola]AZN30689.1 Dyp-type peroxidase [Flaviflexus salsibiostraticola]